MITVDKKLVYDWVGGNEWLFKTINSLDGDPTYNSLMVFLTNLAEHTNFPFFAVAIIGYALLDFTFRKMTKRGGAKHSLVVWIGILSVFAVSFAVDGLAVKLLKDYFSYPRPYVVFGPQDIHMLADAKMGDDHHSFPSGHASFVTVFVASIWPILAGKGPLIGVFLIFAVCWSRIAMGMHFPSDVIGGTLISFVIVLMVRFFLYSLFSKLFKWKC